MKRFLAAALLAAAPLLGQTPTPTPTITPTRTPTPIPAPPARYSLAQQVRPGFGTFSTEATVNLLGDTYYATDYRTFGRVAGNTTTTRKFWCQVGTGSVSAAPAWCALVAGDIPNLAASIITSGTIATARLGSGTANSGTFLRGDQTWATAGGTVTSISTTAPLTGCSSPCTGTASLGVSSFASTHPSPGAVPDATSAGAGTYLDKTGNWTTPSGTGATSPLTLKGDLWAYSTGDTRQPVGANGLFLGADSTASTGLSYQYPGVGTLRVLKETVFAGIATASYSNGSTTTIDGSGYTCTLGGTGAVDMVATGLRLRKGSGSTSTTMSINAGNTGDFASIVGEGRYRRGGWAYWTRTASFDMTNTTNNFTELSSNISGVYPKWGFALRHRVRNLNGAPSTTTGGLAFDYWANNTDANPSSYPGVATPDVLMVYVRDPLHLDFYYGTYSGGWPTMESMTFVGSAVTTGFVSTANMGVMTAAVVAIGFYTGTQASSTGTYEIIYDRWRITTWE